MAANIGRTDIFENMSVPRAVAALAFPTIISQLISMVYNLADTFFVGQTGDPNQVAAVALVFPAFMTLSAITNLFGVGGSSLIARSLGAKNPEKAKNTASFCFYSAVIVALVYAFLVVIFKPNFLNILGASDKTAGFTDSYLNWVLIIGGVPTVLNMLLGHLVRAEGGARQASIGISLGGILNIILDPIFILPFGLDMKVEGAAIATVLSNAAATAYFLVYIYKKRRTTVVSLDPRRYSLRESIPSEVVSVGFPAAFNTFIASVSNMVMNNLIAGYGEHAVAAVGIVKKVDMLPMNVTMGFSQGVLPLMAYNYAAKNYRRMHDSHSFARNSALIFSLVCVFFFEIFASQIVRLFIDDAQTVLLGADFLRIMCLITPFTAINFLIITFFQATGRGREALIVSLCRKGVIDIPLCFLLDAFIPMYGIIWAQPLSDLLSIGIAFAMYWNFNKKLGTARTIKM